MRSQSGSRRPHVDMHAVSSKHESKRRPSIKASAGCCEGPTILDLPSMQSLATQRTVLNSQQTFSVSMDNDSESIAPQTISFGLIVSREGEISIDVGSETSIYGRRTIEIVVGSGSATVTICPLPRLNNSLVPIASSSTVTVPLVPAPTTATSSSLPTVMPLRTSTYRSHNHNDLTLVPVQAPSTSPTTRRSEPTPNAAPVPSTASATPVESVENEDPPPYSRYPPATREDLIPHPPAPPPQVLPRIVHRTRVYSPGPAHAPYVAAPLPPVPRIRDLCDAMQRGEFVPQILPVEEEGPLELPWGGFRARRRGRDYEDEDDDSEDERPAKRSRVSSRWCPFNILRRV
ncbi:hypothetical protein C8R47DRAFT_1152537 [Mycena vitilis]|nr:hypothetical protein C8R47DRAFT_1152537 [Mycena vitilis]